MDDPSSSPSSSPPPPSTTTIITSCVLVRPGTTSSTLLVGCCFASPRSSPRQDEDDARRMELTLYQFEDGTDLINLEAVLVRMGAGKCHVCEGTTITATASDNRALKQADKRLVECAKNLKLELVTHKSIKDVAKTAWEQDVKLLIGEDAFLPHALKLASQEWSLALHAASVLAHKEGYVRSSECFGGFQIDFAALDAYIRMDAAAMSALNLFPSGMAGESKESSVFGVLNNVITKMGSRLLSRWVRQPLRDKTTIMARQDVIKALVQPGKTTRDELRTFLKSVPDLDHSLSRLARKRAGLIDLYNLYVFASTLPDLVKLLDATEFHNVDAMKPFHTTAQSLCSSKKFGKYKALVENLLDFDLVPREFLVKAEHDETGTLQKLREERQEAMAQIESARNKLEKGAIKNLEFKWEESAKFVKTHGPHFTFNKKYISEVETISTKGAKTLVVFQHGIRWTDDSLQIPYQTLCDVTEKLKTAQEEFVKKAVEIAVTYEPVIEMASCLIAELDVFCALAHLATHCPAGSYVCPTFEGEDIFFPNARHPCVELQNGVTFVPNTHDMVRKKSRFQIMTGPNMGGKSVYLRQLGCLIVMAHMGSFVPCDEGAKVPIIDAVLARVGAGDAQLRGISTFMAEMIEAANMLNHATKDSLLIIDELGRGTSTNDGFGLAWAISEHVIKQKQCFAIFATHFHELTSLPKLVDAAVNKHVAAYVDPQTAHVTMLHEVREGPCNDSYGINIAEIAGFPATVVANARHKLTRLEKFSGFDMDEEERRKRVRGEQEEDTTSMILDKLKRVVDMVDGTSVVDFQWGDDKVWQAMNEALLG